jgi:hypothetical protein
LNQQRGHFAVVARRFHIERQSQALPEANLFHVQLHACQLHFLAERNRCALTQAQRRAQEVR